MPSNEYNNVLQQQKNLGIDTFDGDAKELMKVLKTYNTKFRLYSPDTESGRSNIEHVLRTIQDLKKSHGGQFS